MSISSSKTDHVVEFPAANPSVPPGISDETTSMLFRQCLLDNLRDGIIFVDAHFRILAWSQAVEVMTGINATKVEGLTLTSQLLGLLEKDGAPIVDTSIPLIEVLGTYKKKSGTYRLIGRSGRELKVEISFSPVRDSAGTAHGAVIQIHDSSVQLDLQRQLRDLYEFSMLDPLTQIANRAEFEKSLEEFVRANQRTDFKCSLIVCDIDYFKQINDNFNHHIGDQALVSFAALLKTFVRSQDVVARYGGEEFVILCANCDIESAVQRAEEIRQTLIQTPQPMLNGKCITASFGVSELRPGDCPTDVFVRADTALLRAKELGRNRVVEAEIGESGGLPMKLKSNEPMSPSGVNWRKIEGLTLHCEEYFTRAPLAVLVERLRGYILETESDIQRVELDSATIVLETEDPENYGRKGRFMIDIEFKERDEEDKSTVSGRRQKTFIRITVREGKRSWFATNAIDLAPQVITEIRRYFMINDDASKVSVPPATSDDVVR